MGYVVIEYDIIPTCPSIHPSSSKPSGSTTDSSIHSSTRTREGEREGTGGSARVLGVLVVFVVFVARSVDRETRGAIDRSIAIEIARERREAIGSERDADGGDVWDDDDDDDDDGETRGDGGSRAKGCGTNANRDAGAGRGGGRGERERGGERGGELGIETERGGTCGGG